MGTACVKVEGTNHLLDLYATLASSLESVELRRSLTNGQRAKLRIIDGLSFELLRKHHILIIEVSMSRKISISHGLYRICCCDVHIEIDEVADIVIALNSESRSSNWQVV